MTFPFPSLFLKKKNKTKQNKTNRDLLLALLLRFTKSKQKKEKKRKRWWLMIIDDDWWLMIDDWWLIDDWWWEKCRQCVCLSVYRLWFWFWLNWWEDVTCISFLCCFFFSFFFNPRLPSRFRLGRRWWEEDGKARRERSTLVLWLDLALLIGEANHETWARPNFSTLFFYVIYTLCCRDRCFGWDQSEICEDWEGEAAGSLGGRVPNVRKAVCPRMEEAGTAYWGECGLVGLYHHRLAISDWGWGRLGVVVVLTNSWKSTCSYTWGGS